MVEWKKLGEVCKVLRGKRLTKSQLSETDGYPVLHGGSTPMGFYSEYNRKANTTVVVNTGNAGSVFFYNKEFWSSDACFSLYPNNEIIDKFLYLYVYGCENILKGKIRAGAMPTIDSNAVESLIIPIPSLSEQTRIVGILDTFTSAIDNLKEQIAQRRKQYEYYRDQLLDLEGEADYFELLDLCDYVDYRGKTPSKVDSGIFLVTAKNIRKGYIDYDISKEYISEDDYEEVMHRGKPQKGDVLITTEAPLGNVAQIDNEFIALAQRVIKYRPKDKRLSSSFLKYILLGREFQIRLEKEATGATAKGIKGSKLHKMQIPVPALQKQQRIVSILDTFETSIQNLEAQLKERGKQYEYYRNKLLTFE